MYWRRGGLCSINRNGINMRKDKNKIDWNNLGFNVIRTKSMFIATFTFESGWSDGELIPYGNISISPASAALNYGQGVFEGTKAYKSSTNRIVTFRLADNSSRMNASNTRLCIPEISKELFINAVKSIIIDNQDFIPSLEQGSLYIRPVIWGTGAMLGVKPATEYTFMIYVSPVGLYFSNGLKALNVLIDKNYHRTAKKGIGGAKAIGNYSASLFPMIKAQEKGFDEIIFLNSSNENIIDEARSANIFIVKNKVVKTPALDGSILPGITRDSILKISEKILNLEIQECDISINDILNADEVFFTGTAVIVAPVGYITYEGKLYNFNKNNNYQITMQLRNTIIGIQNETIEDPFGWTIPLDNL